MLVTKDRNRCFWLGTFSLPPAPASVLYTGIETQVRAVGWCAGACCLAVLLERGVSYGCLGLGFPLNIVEIIILSCFSRG